MHFIENIVHRISDRARHSAIDRGRCWFVLLRSGVRNDAAGRNRTGAQSPQKLLVTLVA